MCAKVKNGGGVENPYHNDMILPVGWLRESASGAKRADLVVVTKCPEKHSYAKLQEIQYILNN